MRIPAGVAAMVVGICAGENLLPAVGAVRSVSVCLQAGPDGLVRGTAEPLVSQIFAAIGVRIQWKREVAACIADRGIIVSLSYDTPTTTHPDAWGYALPYERNHVVVFYDRVQRTVRRTGTKNLMAYVLAHELTHMLQEVNRHSASGIMKPVWDSGDYFDMERGTLRFAPEDVDLIYMGLHARQAFATAKASSGK